MPNKYVRISEYQFMAIFYTFLSLKSNRKFQIKVVNTQSTHLIFLYDVSENDGLVMLVYIIDRQSTVLKLKRVRKMSIIPVLTLHGPLNTMHFILR